MANAIDLTSFSDTCRTAAKAINQRIDIQIATLEFHEIQELTNKAQDLLIKSKTLLEMDAIQIADDGTAALTELTNATTDINKAIKTLKTIQTVIGLTGKLVLFAGAVISGDFGGLVSSAQDIISMV